MSPHCQDVGEELDGVMLPCSRMSKIHEVVGDRKKQKQERSAPQHSLRKFPKTPSLGRRDQERVLVTQAGSSARDWHSVHLEQEEPRRIGQSRPAVATWRYSDTGPRKQREKEGDTMSTQPFDPARYKAGQRWEWDTA